MENVIGLLDYGRQLLGEWLQSSVSFKLFDRARVNSFAILECAIELKPNWKYCGEGVN